MSRFTSGGSTAAAVAALIQARTGQNVDVQSLIAREQLAQKYSIQKTAASASSVVTPGMLTFFQDGYSPQTTNLIRPGQLAQGKGAFLARALTLQIDVDQETQSDSEEVVAATAVTNALVVEGIRRMLQRGAITLYKGTRQILTAFGCYNFPQGGGPYIQAAVATAVGATNLSVGAFNVVNGSPDADNMRWFPSPILFTSDDTVNLTIDFGATTFPATTSDKIRIMASLWGSDFTDAAN